MQEFNTKNHQENNELFINTVKSRGGKGNTEQNYSLKSFFF